MKIPPTRVHLFISYHLNKGSRKNSYFFSGPATKVSFPPFQA